MSIVVAVRVRPVYDSATAQGGRRTAQRRDANDSTNLLDDPSVCGALRFVRDTHITFTQDAMEALEAERLEAASAAAGHQSVGPSAALRSGQFPSSRRSQTPPASQRTSQELLPPHPRGQSPVLSRASSAARRSAGASPLRSSSHATLATQHRAPSERSIVHPRHPTLCHSHLPRRGSHVPCLSLTVASPQRRTT
ncbi:Hypothetical protein, putative [Bodo saltans]|uniref:Uncharacterized protein n=1 Tax=Bodo saltans TaxID=75058 RepID=A0A0S4KF79_BODSA|nr:Hypothetical protein, putative [Bodo saltans]|eukprot:CUI14324.1 Hypothetical protein, putative [Bodo saltans]